MKHARRRFVKVAGLVPAALAVHALPLASRAAAADTEKLKVGIIGSGRVGGTLGEIWAKAGHDVMLSSRDIDHDRTLAAKIGSNARAGSPREAAAFGDLLMIAVPYGALPGIGKDLADILRGKVVIDTCNPIVGRDGEIATWAREKGAGLASAELLAGARIVRTFNAIGYAQMAAARERPGRVGMPMASDDAQAVALVSRLVRDVGFEPVLVGGLAMGKHLMPGTPLAGERAAEEILKIARSLN
jgi:predicted dinucleotide-binding enzyme